MCVIPGKEYQYNINHKKNITKLLQSLQAVLSMYACPGPGLTVCCKHYLPHVPALCVVSNTNRCIKTWIVQWHIIVFPGTDSIALKNACATWSSNLSLKLLLYGTAWWIPCWNSCITILKSVGKNLFIVQVVLNNTGMIKQSISGWIK